MNNKTPQELAVELVGLWLENEASVSNTIGRTTVDGSSKSVREISQAYIDFFNTINEFQVPEKFESESSDSNSTDTNSKNE